MIERARFKDFKSLHDVHLDLRPLTLVVGANGAGKSSILQGLNLLLQTAGAPPVGRGGAGKPALVFAGANLPERLLRRGSEPFFELECLGEGFGAFGLQAQVKPDEAASFTVWRGTKTERMKIQYGLPTRKDEDELFEPLHALRLESAMYLRLNARTAAAPHYSDAEQPELEIDGYGLPSVLQRLQLSRDGRFEAIEAALYRVVPSVLRLRTVLHTVRRPERLRLNVDGTDGWVDQVRERRGSRIEADVKGGGWISADLLSDGTVLTLALLTALHDRAPRTLLLDDLDQALHPAAQGRLLGELRAVLSARPEVQVVATTHSPFLVDHAAVEEVRVVRLDEAGGTHCRALGEHPKWLRRSGFLKPGEFWSGVGEDWVVD